MRYLKGTADYVLCYQGSDLQLRGYSDADWGSDLDERKSTTGYVFLLNNGAITWSSKKQPCIVLSTMEAEYIACSAAVQEVVWLQRFLKHLDIGTDTSNPGDRGGFTFNRRDDMGDEPSPIFSLLPTHHWVGFHSNWVLHNVDEIRDYIGISCKGFEEQFKALLTTIEEGQPFLARSFLEKVRDLKSLSCLINYDAREGSASKGRHKDRANSDT
ncbi:uncharacterized protein LOC122304776 [Carya illinoinensis]|uniref:uncharacterized protein LOC122304776 n=1 Tax=Carya illinoinensis TaxID=32201 RepID=UPI001C724D3C|nr:uncharacterized protein LOC122304776 [Carya illinoinensis]